MLLTSLWCQSCVSCRVGWCHHCDVSLVSRAIAGGVVVMSVSCCRLLSSL